MDENSREEVTLETDGEKPKIQDGSGLLPNEKIKVGFKIETSGKQVSDRVCSSIDTTDLSGPSVCFSAPDNDIKDQTLKDTKDEETPKQDMVVSESVTLSTTVQTEEIQETNLQEEQILDSIQVTNLREEHSSDTTQESSQNSNEVLQMTNMEIQVEERSPELLAPIVLNRSPRKGSLGPPPSYSFVMKQKRKAPKPRESDQIIQERIPPPNYRGVQGIYMTPEDERLEQFCALPSFSEPIWRSRSQPALCPRCGIIVLTKTHSHDSLATHITALALCLFGCWPCCLLPYCLSVCKNTYHHCPFCQYFLGAYTPW